MSSILVPIDGSEASIHALQYAITLSELTKDQIMIVNVQPSFRTPNVQRFISAADIHSYQEELYQEALSGAIDILNNLQIPFEQKLLIGSPAQEICNEAVRLNANHIVMGSRGVGMLKRNLLGSVSYGVLHEAPCPVTIVR